MECTRASLVCSADGAKARCGRPEITIDIDLTREAGPRLLVCRLFPRKKDGDVCSSRLWNYCVSCNFVRRGQRGVLHPLLKLMVRRYWAGGCEYVCSVVLSGVRSLYYEIDLLKTY